MDQSLRHRRAVNALRHRHHRQRRRRWDDGAGAGGAPARASWSSSAASGSRRNPRTGARRPSGSTCAIGPRSSGSTARVNSSRPTRTTASAATRSSGAACSIGCGGQDFEEVEHVDGVSPAWPIDYDTLAPYYDRAEQLYHVHGQHGDDPTEPARGPFPYAPDSALARHGGDRRRLAAAGTASLAAAAWPDPAGRRGWLPAVQHLQLVPVPHPRQERRRDLRHRAGARRTRTSNLWTDAFARRLVDRSRRTAGSRPSKWNADGETRQTVRAGLFVVSCGAVNSAALLLRSGNGARDGLGQFLRTRGQALHGAPGDHDAGLSPVQEERDRLPEDRRDQRFLPARVRRRPTRSGRFNRRGGRTA